MEFSGIALLLFYLGVAHLSSLLFERFRLPSVVAYIATGLLIRFLGLPAPSEIWGTIAVFSLVFIGLHSGLAVNIGRGELGRVSLVAAINVLLSFAVPLLLLTLLTGDLTRSAVLSILLANTATEGVIALSRYVRYEVDLEAALRISIGDDLAVLLVATAMLAFLGGLSAVGLTISLVSVALGVAVLTATLRRGLSVGILNAVTMAVLFTAVGLSVDSVGPLLGGYFIGMTLGLARSLGDPLLRVASHVETIADSLEVVNNLITSPLVFTYVGYAVSPESADPVLVVAGLAGAVAGKVAVVAVLSRTGLLRVFSKTEVASLVAVRGALESAIALTALNLGVLSTREFSSLVLTALLTYPLAATTLVLSRANSPRRGPPARSLR
jgi:Kef-type K+ transport system membrane component KefB